MVLQTTIVHLEGKVKWRVSELFFQITLVLQWCKIVSSIPLFEKKLSYCLLSKSRLFICWWVCWILLQEENKKGKSTIFRTVVKKETQLIRCWKGAVQGNCDTILWKNWDTTECSFERTIASGVVVKVTWFSVKQFMASFVENVSFFSGMQGGNCE